MRLPFLPTRVGLGSDVERFNPEIETITSPYADGEELLAMPALELDCALIHVNRCDARGNTQILGPDPYFDDLFCRAAQRRFATCERIVETDALVAGGCIHTLDLDRSLIDGVVEIPFGAHPSCCVPDYGIDTEHLQTYTAAKGAEGWAEYRKQFVDLDSHDAYLKAIGGGERVGAIPAPVF